MQNSDGGWGAFDHENNLQFLNHIPFADHNAMLDPSTADVTARAVECLGQMGWPATHPVIERARAFLRQRSDGRWLLVRPLGRKLCLRNERRFARAGDGRAWRPQPTARRPRTGCARCRIPTAASASRFLSYYDPSLKGKGQEHRVANRLGIDWPAGGVRAERSGGGTRRGAGSSRIRMRTAPGTKMNLLAQVSRAFSI